MSEDNHPIFGKIDATPDQGFKISIIEIEELRNDSNVLVVQKDDEHGFQAVKGIFKLVKKEGGKIELVSMEEDLGDPKVRKALAKALVQMNKDAIIEQSLIVTEKALSRKSTNQLKKFFRQKKEGHKLEMKTKVGCVYMCIGNEECVL